MYRRIIGLYLCICGDVIYVCVFIFFFLLPVVKAQDYNFCILIYILKSFLFYDFLCNSKVNLILKNVHFAH